MNQPDGLSPEGLTALQKEEGTILRVYKDVAGIGTVCTGHVVRPADRSWLDDGVTMTECRDVLEHDVGWCREAIHTLVRVDLGAHQYDALCSLIFNIGPSEKGFAGSTVLRTLNAGDFSGAGDAFLLWCNATVNGVKTPVLLGRRQRERTMFLSATYPAEVDPTEWLELRASGQDVQVDELTEAEKNEVLAQVALSLREVSWRDMDEARREHAFADTEPPPAGSKGTA
jgi:lysozyme